MSAPAAETVRTVPRITGLTTRLLTVPLRRSWGVEAPENHVIATELYTDDGGTGFGFSWTPTIGPQAVKALLDCDIAPFVTGLPANPETVWDALWKRLHEAGGGGLTTIAMAGVDLALWDVQARSAGTSVTGFIGQRQDSVEVYGSGVNLHYTLEELVAQTERWVAAGHRAVKIKVGKPDLREDAERVAAVRTVLGPDRRLMIDANQRWDLPTTLRALEVLAGYGLDWLEEPLRADDLWAYRRLRKHSPVPIALGENLHTIYRFRDFIEAEAVDIIQPNIIRVGGITPFRRIVELARTHSIKVMPHLLPELSGQLALTLAEPTMVEDVEEASFEQLGLLAGPSPVRFTNSRLATVDRQGLGLRFRDAL
ncbi:mandelate racemase/muconate lactonizing enzyme family protein [Arthrobacter sp. DNA4]|uniref:mandelate racemase/muconate lactonizing enzyme family protein n=1 Tax=Micrococcaceae TaxID=1268 RepID=UPI0020CC02EF|nr:MULTISPECIES: mandelate racemase/muconate lactonizing enzyme family protein [Micrococcaceae]UTT68970.1 mandelate racemase/muconate lactonizing enzyme family protein [Arthrobacter sp. DNA4]WRT13246.1 mandelate racemase/muconate lactonizing enzyme family protein [Pseudarthrobacter sp. LT1]